MVTNTLFGSSFHVNNGSFTSQAIKIEFNEPSIVPLHIFFSLILLGLSTNMHV